MEDGESRDGPVRLRDVEYDFGACLRWNPGDNLGSRLSGPVRRGLI